MVVLFMKSCKHTAVQRGRAGCQRDGLEVTTLQSSAAIAGPEAAAALWQCRRAELRTHIIEGVQQADHLALAVVRGVRAGVIRSSADRSESCAACKISKCLC